MEDQFSRRSLIKLKLREKEKAVLIKPHHLEKFRRLEVTQLKILTGGNPMFIAGSDLFDLMVNLLMAHPSKSEHWVSQSTLEQMAHDNDLTELNG